MNLSILNEALQYYASGGYQFTDVPWMVDTEAYYSTKPANACDVYVPCWDLNMVASGEQSFVHQMLQGKGPTGKACCITPCYRYETYDEYHHPYFMKVELIRVDDTSDDALSHLIEDAFVFFNYYLTAQVVDMGDGSYDIVGINSGVELGSYGRRTYKAHTWLYGTGVAEPRLTQVRTAEMQLSTPK